MLTLPSLREKWPSAPRFSLVALRSVSAGCPDAQAFATVSAATDRAVTIIARRSCLGNEFGAHSRWRADGPL